MIKNTDIFEYIDYKKYLKKALPTSGEQRGLRSKLGAALRCQSSFISRVISGPADFSPEHAVIINHFIQHTEMEGDFFVLLVQYARAGSKELEAHYLKQIRQIQEKREQIRERIQVKQELSKENQMTYYSAWYFSAIHILITVPQFQTPAEIARHLSLPLNLVSESLDFLVSTGMAIQDGARFKAGTTRLHLGKDSPMISKHHANWRMRSIQALDRRSQEDLFFSGPISISEEDAIKIRSNILKMLEQLEPTIRASTEEAVFCLGMDFFRV
ncbi:TIGR02147 family protein [Bdellovibrionota bacterium FG-1]